MGSPLSPVIANVFMEAFEHSALDQAPLKQTVFLWYVDDTFIIWSHEHEKWLDFLAFMNSLNKNFRFTM